MGTRPLGTFLRRLREAVGAREGRGLTDAQLPERFVAGRDEAAFEVLVWRHGPMVLAVCRRLLGHEQDAEDAFQATFLALARKAGSIARRETLAAWLHRVASRVALRARRRTAQRAVREQAGVEALPAPAVPPAATELRPVLDEEVNRLPARYRIPFVLCYLEARTQQEAAHLLGCPPGTVASRLAWARDRLRARLTRRGLGLGAVALLAPLLPHKAPAAVPAALVRSTVQAAPAFASGGTTAAPAPAALAEGVLRLMQLARIKTAAAVLLVVGAFVAGTVWIGPAARAGKPAAGPEAELLPGTGPSLRLPAPTRAALGVQTAEVKPRPARERLLRLPGTLAIDPNRLTSIRARFAPAEVVTLGQVPDPAPPGAGPPRLRPLRVSDRVQKGQLLAVLSSADVALKKHDLLDALVQLKFDEANLERIEKARDAVPEAAIRQAERNVTADRNAASRARNTLRLWGIPKKDIDAVCEEADRVSKRKGKRDRARTEQWDRVELRAPDGGVIVERSVALHELVSDKTANLFQIARMDRLLVLANAPEDAHRALLDLPAQRRRWTVRAAGAAPGKGVPGTIDEIGYLIEPYQHTAVVKGHIDNPGGKLRAGQPVWCTIELSPALAEVAVPTAALVEEGGKTFVFVQPDANKPVYSPRRVAVVRRGRDVAHVRTDLTPGEERQGLQPLRPGDRVVTGGAVELKALLEDLKSRAPR